MSKTTVSSTRSGTRSLRRIARGYLDRAEESLTGDPPSSGAVHAARKSLKKARTGLRLLRPALTASIYRRENVALRDAAHSLNEARDACVLLQTLQSLRSHESSLRSSTTVAELASELQGSQARAEARLHDRRVLDSLRRALKQAGRRARDWPVGRHGWTVLGPALRRVYRSGRRCTPSARSMPPDEALHEWRKQVKYLRYAFRILKPIAPGALGALERRAHRLSDHLGAAHDLALLAGRALAYGAAHSRHHRDQGLRRLLKIIEERRRRLAGLALLEGELLYQEPPRAVQGRFARDWHRWRNSDP